VQTFCDKKTCLLFWLVHYEIITLLLSLKNVIDAVQSEGNLYQIGILRKNITIINNGHDVRYEPDTHDMSRWVKWNLRVSEYSLSIIIIGSINKELGRRASIITGDRHQRDLFQQLSVALQKGELARSRFRTPSQRAVATSHRITL